nr:ATP-binding protein [Bacteroidales bacterium]
FFCIVIKYLNVMQKNTSTFNTLTCFTFLSKSLQDSRLLVLSQIDDRFVSTRKDTDDEDRRHGRRNGYCLSDEEISDILNQLNQFANYLQTTPLQAAIFVALYTCQLEEFERSEIESLGRFYDISTVETLPMKSEFEVMKKKGYFKIKGSGLRMRRRCVYQIDEQLEHAITLNEPFQLGIAEKIDRYKFCQLVSDEIEKRNDDESSTSDLFQTIQELEENHTDLSFVQLVMKKIKSLEDRLLFYEICDNHIDRGETYIDGALSYIYDDTAKKFKVATRLINETHSLFQNQWIEKKPAAFFSRAGLVLSSKGKEIFLEKDFVLLQENQKDDPRMITPDKIDTKTLFFSKELSEEVNFLQKSLKNTQFKNLQKRLKEKKLPQGVTAIFYGLPGTGKTETAMQIAKATGRKVMHVDISASKTCWYGESEKLVKKIFTDYADKCKNEKLKPILLFNEADALLGKRREDVARSVDQTDNAIQNILLEEMEKLKGIMIATTNLADNLDDAFERRFLFKIKFDKPTKEAKCNIWKDKMPALPADACEKLALEFDFSGGEIDNIVRKFTMQEVLRKAEPTYEAVQKLCKSEKLNRKRGHKTVGF